MTQHDDRLYLGHMLDMARLAREFTDGVSKEQFDRNEMMRRALVNALQTLGEAARHVSPAGRANVPEIPWPRVIGMRHRLVRDYMNIDFDVVWQVVQEDLSSLIAALETVLSSESPG